MKIVALLCCFLSLLANPKLSEVRNMYPDAIDNEEITKKLHGQLGAVTESDDPALVAYKGAVMTMMAKYTRKKGEKLKFFKGGVALIEAALEADPENIEVRTIRLGIQENAPKFLRYHKNKEEDKLFILNNFASTKNADIKSFVRAFVEQSTEFSKAEKAGF